MSFCAWRLLAGETLWIELSWKAATCSGSAKQVTSMNETTHCIHDGSFNWSALFDYMATLLPLGMFHVLQVWTLLDRPKLLFFSRILRVLDPHICANDP